MSDPWMLPIAVVVFVDDSRFQQRDTHTLIIAPLMTRMTGRDLIANQGALFTEMEQRPTRDEPRGFSCGEDIISEDVEATLVAQIEQVAVPGGLLRFGLNENERIDALFFGINLCINSTSRFI